MPPKRNQLNGFWLFAISSKGKWKAQGLTVSTNEHVLALANPLWKSMSADEKKSWDIRAKDERRQKKEDMSYERLDNTGNVLGSRKDPLEESRKRRERDIGELTSQWHGKDLTQEKFYFINFQDLCETTVGEDPDHRTWLPREMAISEYCLSKGILNTYHQFIWPSSIPLGFRLKAEQKSSEYHRIPVEETERDSHNYPAIFRKATEMLKGGMTEGRHPPLYCLAQDYEKTKYLCEWLWSNANPGFGIGPRFVNPLGRVRSLEDLVGQLLMFSGNPDTENIATFQIVRTLDGSQWDYIASTPCEFHQGVDVSRYCALGFVRKAAYTVSDMVAMHYGIELGEKHVPVREEPVTPQFRFVPPTRNTRGPGRGRASRRNDDGSDGRNAGKSYLELARPNLMKDSSEDSGEDTGGNVSSSSSDWPRRPYSSSATGKGNAERAGGAWVPSAPNAPVPGQFTSRPTQQAAARRTDNESEESEDEFPTPQMAAMRLSSAPPPSMMGGGRRGRGSTPRSFAAAVAPAPATTTTTTATVRLPPGFGSVNPAAAGVMMPPGGGRGFLPEGGSPPSMAFPGGAAAVVVVPIPVGRGSFVASAPPPPANQQRAVGRGVGRGTLLLGGGASPPAQALGRGRMGQGTRPGRDSHLQGGEVVAGASGSVGLGGSLSFAGRGAFHLPTAVYGASAAPPPQLPSFVMEGAGSSPPGLGGRKEAGGGQERLGSDGGGGAPRVAPSSFVVGDAGLDAHTDNFEPAMVAGAHFTPSPSSSSSQQQSLEGAVGFASGWGPRGGMTPASGRGVAVGRGFMPASRGRGSMLKKNDE